MPTPTASSPATSPRVLLTVEAAAEQLSIGRTSMYALVKSGEVVSVQLGRLRRVPSEALTAYVGRLMSEQHGRESLDHAA